MTIEFTCTLFALLGFCVGGFCNVLIRCLLRDYECAKKSSPDNDCEKPVSVRYHLAVAANGIIWLLAGANFGEDLLKAALYCVMFSLLCVIAVIDWRTFKIPNGLNFAIFLLGIARLATDPANWKLYLAGLFCVSLFFLLVWFITGGAGIGMGDVKLMGAAGLLIGWKNIIFAMFIGCVIGAVIHLGRMKKGADKRLAFAPYLAAGIWIAAMFGDRLLAWYLGLFGF